MIRVPLSLIYNSKMQSTEDQKAFADELEEKSDLKISETTKTFYFSPY